MKKLTTGKIWQFAAGQFGWAMLSGIISNWLVYFYQPDKTAISQGQTVFIPQGLVVFGIFTIIGGITAFGRIFDAFTDPMIASLSDRCTSKNGRRIPFLKWASLPLALSTVLVFWSPVNKNSWINGVFLLIMILAYYLSITAYCTPYNALIPELGHTQQERLNISTVISFTFIAGTAVAYLAPTIWGMFIPAFGRVGAIRMTFTLMAAIAFICMLVPVFCIREKDYVDTVPAKESAFGSLAATFKNGEFRKFVASDIFYWIALTMFQTGLPFFVTSLLKLPETMTTLYFVGMTALSLVFYIPVNKLTPKLGKKSRAWKGFYTAIITGCSVGIIIFMVGFFGGGVLSSFFTNDSEVIAQSAAYLKGFSADCILTCVLFSSIGYFNGCGKSIPVMIQGITSAFCIRIPVSIIMSRLPETSLTYVAMAAPATSM